MVSKDNVDLECYLVTKHSWKGKYKRILSIGTCGTSTYNPDKFDLTNRWLYSDIVAATPNKTSNVIIVFTYLYFFMQEFINSLFFLLL